MALHPLHTTLTELSYRSVDRTVEVSVRAFADDFRAAVGPDTADAAAFAYFAKVLIISDPEGRVLPLAWCGARRAGDLVWLCLRAHGARGLSGVRVRAGMLFDLYQDQINIVQASYDGRRVSLLFTHGDEPKPLP
jgi:hypothetical protein